MNDRESLELAAKAAGIVGTSVTTLGGVPAIRINPHDITPWNPLTDDGDALRLAVKLSLTIYQWPGEICVCNEKGTVNEVVERVSDIYASTRRAIVRAAAEIGRQMQEGGEE